MKKSIKFVAILLIVCMSFMFAGCDLFGRNNIAYYNKNVISINYKDGSKIEISRKDFLVAYNNYGQNLISQYSYTEEQAKEATVDTLVNKKILLKEAKDLAKTEKGESIKLTSEEKQELRYQTYEYLMSNAREYEDEIREDRNLPKAEEGESAEETSKVTYTPYEKQAELVFDSVTQTYRIKTLDNDDLPVRSRVFDDFDAIYTAFINETKNNTADEIAREEYRRYLASLQSSQKLLGTKYSEEELIKEEIKRIYENLEDNEYITKYQEYQQKLDGYSIITVSQMLEKYKSMITVSKFKYENDLETYESDMMENRANVDYFVNDDFFYVAHILIKFSDEQQEEYDSIADLSNDGQGYHMSAEVAEQKKKALYENVKASVRNSEGEVVSTDSVSAKEVLKQVEIALANATTKEAKDEAFKQLMYKYNEDDGIMNANYPYVIGEKEGQSKMVDSFTEASRELNLNGTYGAVSGLVESEYGLHIIYYMGKCENPFTIGQDGINFRDEDILRLYETKLNNLNNKTIFDLVYEQLVSDSYSQFENMNLIAMKSTYGIEVSVSDKLV